MHEHAEPEFLAILGHIDHVGVRANHLAPARPQRLREIVRDLAADGDDDARGAFGLRAEKYVRIGRVRNTVVQGNER